MDSYVMLNMVVQFAVLTYVMRVVCLSERRAAHRMPMRAAYWLVMLTWFVALALEIDQGMQGKRYLITRQWWNMAQLSAMFAVLIGFRIVSRNERQQIEEDKEKAAAACTEDKQKSSERGNNGHRPAQITR